MNFRLFALLAVLVPASLCAQLSTQTIDGWKMQDCVKVAAEAAIISTAGFEPQGWYIATVPGTVLTTLVNDGVYPEPLWGENMRAIPESLNKTSYWYRTTITVPAAYKGRHMWIHFGGINYAAQIWVNGREAGTMRGAFIRGDFDISEFVQPGRRAVLAVLVAPQPHPGVPHERTVALGIGQNGGETAIVSGVSATRPNRPRPVATCVFWPPTCQTAAVPFFPSITIAGNVRTALKS
jgi:mannosylglycoprotein endo-beta-mannosidase